MAFVDLVNRPDLRICRSGSLIVVVFGAAPVKLSDVLLVSEHEQTAASERGRISIIVVGPVAHERSEEEVKRKSEELDRWLADVAIASATVIPGGGLGATLRRSAQSALTLVAKNSARKKVFGDLGEALSWVKSRPDQVPDVHRITLDQLTEHLGHGRVRVAA